MSKHAVRIPCNGGELRGDLVIPADATGLVIFAHGSGSSRLSPRNQMVAGVMHRHHLATLLIDLLTLWEALAEENTGALRFNIPFLTHRLTTAIRWAENDARVAHLGVGLFGASTGAAAALCAAASIPEIEAVVSRGGRTDMAEVEAAQVSAPTLLIVGGDDRQVMCWNERTLALLPCVNNLIRIPGATHLFQERGALEEVATRASEWFENFLSPITSKGTNP